MSEVRNVRVDNVLAAVGLTVADAAKKTDMELLREVPGLGPAGIRYIRKAAGLVSVKVHIPAEHAAAFLELLEDMGGHYDK